MLHYWDQSWDLRIAECPCDMHFLEWLEEQKIRDKAIFHFGTGSHHIVGLKTAEDGSNNAVFGITASPAEYDAYVKMLIENPRLGHTYKAYFGDIYQLDRRLLPMFDIVRAVPRRRVPHREERQLRRADRSRHGARNVRPHAQGRPAAVLRRLLCVRRRRAGDRRAGARGRTDRFRQLQDPAHLHQGHLTTTPQRAAMSLFNIYLRAIGMLKAERGLAASLAVANCALAVVALAEPLLFGRVVDALSKNESTGGTIAAWAVIGLFGIVASVIVAVFADRLAHRQRLAAMSLAFDRAITLPISYHAEKGSAAVVRNILAGTDMLFGTWLTFMREQLAAVVSIIFLVPTAIAMDWRMAALLGVLAIVYAVVNILTVNRTSDGQAAVERYHIQVSGRVGDVLGNVTVVQSYARLQAEASELQASDGPAAVGAVPGADMVGPAHLPDPRRLDDHHGLRVRARLGAGQPWRDDRRPDRRLRRLRRRC